MTYHQGIVLSCACCTVLLSLSPSALHLHLLTMISVFCFWANMAKLRFISIPFGKKEIEEYPRYRDAWTQLLYPLKTEDFTLEIFYSNDSGREASTIQNDPRIFFFQLMRKDKIWLNSMSYSATFLLCLLVVFGMWSVVRQPFSNIHLNELMCSWINKTDIYVSSKWNF